jgi:GTP-binding protein
MNPDFQRAKFLTAAASPSGMPADDGFEVAFAGRSNAGKSSAVNRLCHQRRLARTSRTPGRTQQVMFFELDAERRLVDLPGYGFAKVSLALKAGWQALMGDYLRRRRCLRALVVVMDIRHPLTDIDSQMIAWGQEAQLPMLMLLTKADKLKRGAVQRQLQNTRRELRARYATDSAEDGGPNPKIQVEAFSADNGLGVEVVQDYISGWLELPSRPSNP